MPDNRVQENSMKYVAILTYHKYEIETKHQIFYHLGTAGQIHLGCWCTDSSIGKTLPPLY